MGEDAGSNELSLHYCDIPIERQTVTGNNLCELTQFLSKVYHRFAPK